MKAKLVAVIVAILWLAGTQNATAAVLSDVVTLSQNGIVVFQGQLFEGQEPLTQLFIPCPVTICIVPAPDSPNIQVILVEPGGFTSDVLSTDAGPGQLRFESDPEEPIVTLPVPPGTGFVETGLPQDVSSFFLLPSAIANGFVLTMQSDVEGVPTPEPATLLLLASGVLAIAGGATWRKRHKQ